MANLVSGYLPQCYRDKGQAVIVDALTQGTADLYSTLLSPRLDAYASRHLEPATCLPKWLDVLAYWGGWGDYWDSSWPEATKRTLLSNNDYIWRNRGNRDCIAFLFQAFGLQAAIAQSTGWVLGTSTLTVTLLNDPFNFTIKVPASYGTAEKSLITRLCSQFLPCWVSITFSN